MTTVVVDACGANISSVLAALRRLGCEPVVSADAEEIGKAERVILPGVGAAGNAMERLRLHKLDSVIPELTQPVLGVCVGMQVLFRRSAEDDVACLGVFDADLKKFPASQSCPVPHMGWNSIRAVAQKPAHPLLKQLPADTYCYFVHSYHAPVFADTVAACTYGPGPGSGVGESVGDSVGAESSTDSVFTAVVARDNFMGVQFHPERSADAGAKVLENFLNIV